MPRLHDATLHKKHLDNGACFGASTLRGHMLEENRLVRAMLLDANLKESLANMKMRSTLLTDLFAR